MSDNNPTNITFPGGYSNEGRIWIEPPSADQKCDGCGKTDVPLLCMDGSEEEYGYGRLCQHCVAKLFAANA